MTNGKGVQAVYYVAGQDDVGQEPQQPGAAGLTALDRPVERAHRHRPQDPDAKGSLFWNPASLGLDYTVDPRQPALQRAGEVLGWVRTAS